jgi:branched-chain amino acid transport system substrate-binding protein
MSLVKRTIGVAASVAVAFATFVAPVQAAPADCDGDIKLVFQGGLTGGAAQTGIGEYNGFRLAILQYNEKKTASQPKVEVASIDTQASGSQSPALALKTVNDPCVVGVVGGMYSGETAAALPYYLKAGLPVISPSATNPTLPSVGGDVFHRVVANDLVQGPAMAIIAKREGKKIFVVDDQTTYGKGLSDIIKKDVKATLVGKDSVTEGTTNFTSVVAKVKKAGADVVVYAGYYPEASKFIKQLRDNPATKNVKFVSGDGVLDDEYILLAGKYANNTYLTAPAYFLGAADKALTATYKKEYGVNPRIYTLEAYNATLFFLEAIKAGNTDKPSILKFINTKSVKGIGTTMKFDKAGEPSKKFINEFTVKNGKIAYVRNLINR